MCSHIHNYNHHEISGRIQCATQRIDLHALPALLSSTIPSHQALGNSKTGRELILSEIDDITVSVDAYYEDTYRKFKRIPNLSHLENGITEIINFRNMHNKKTIIRVKIMEFTIRPAVIEDLPAITEIYNEAILTTDATFDTEPKTVDEQISWFESHDFRNPILVAEIYNVVTGWVSLSKWSDRYAYTDTVEISFHLMHLTT